MPTAIELRQEAGQWVHEARAMLERVESERRGFDEAEQSAFDKLHADAERNLKLAEAKERQSAADLGFEAPEENQRQIPPDAGETHSGRPTASDEYRNAFINYMRHGEGRMTASQREVLQRGEARATLQQDNDIGGGFFAASEQFINRVLKNADNKLALRQLATVYQVGRGETLGVPTLSSDLTPFAFGGGELTAAVEDTGIEFGKRELRPRDLVNKTIKISRDLLRSSRIDIEAFISERVAYALAQGLEAAYMTGSGAGQPLGLFTASNNGIGTARDVNVGSTTNFTADGLISVQGALKDAYDANARWLFHKDAITLIRKLKDGNQQYIWQPGLALGTQNQILGKPYITSDNVPHTFTSALYGGMYGDFSYYWIADAVSMSVQRLEETYALTNQIGYLFRDMAADGMPVLAEAFVRIKMSA